LSSDKAAFSFGLRGGAAPQPTLVRKGNASDKRRTAAHFRNFDVRAVKRSVQEIPKIQDNEKAGALPRLFLPK
jgi:hypothetical protein